MEVVKTVTPLEIMIMLAIVYVSYKIAMTIYPLIFRRYDDKINHIENDIAKIVSENEALDTKIETSLNALEENLKQDLRDVVDEMRSLIREFRKYITDTEVLKTKVKSLEHRVEKLESK